MSDECKVDGCDREVKHQTGKYAGYCYGHKDQLYRGIAPEDMRPLRKARQLPSNTEERFFALVEKQPRGCWVWTASLINGYGSFSVNGRSRRAHRVAYELLVGPLDDNLVIHHTCSNRACVNPKHLQAIDQQNNIAEMLNRRAYERRIAELEREVDRLQKELGR